MVLLPEKSRSADEDPLDGLIAIQQESFGKLPPVSGVVTQAEAGATPGRSTGAAIRPI